MSEQAIERVVRWRRPQLPWRRWGARRRLTAIDFASTPFAWLVALVLTACALASFPHFAR